MYPDLSYTVISACSSSLLVPSRSAPNSINFSASEKEAIPPAAFTFTFFPVYFLISATSSKVAPAVENPVEEEIRKVHEACQGRILKVIIETCLLSEEEKMKMCEIVTCAGAEYIKTSTGFSTAGATFEDGEAGAGGE